MIYLLLFMAILNFSVAYYGLEDDNDLWPFNLLTGIFCFAIMTAVS